MLLIGDSVRRERHHPITGRADRKCAADNFNRWTLPIWIAADVLRMDVSGKKQRNMVSFQQRFELIAVVQNKSLIHRFIVGI